MCTGPHPFIPAPNTAKLEMVYTFQGTFAENVVYFQNPSGWNATSLALLNSAAFTAWSARIKPAQTSQLTLVRLKATDVAVDNGAYNELSPTSGNTGTEASPPTALGSTVAIKFTTGLSGRSQRGRLFFIGLTEDATDGNKLNLGFGASLADSYKLFMQDIEADIPDTKHVVVSYCTDKAWRTTAGIQEVTGYSADDYIDSQRRRLTGRGM
jgi:hypothetical protein